nr:MAG TPA: hypothetical protein [Caudoviricetes sp.]
MVLSPFCSLQATRVIPAIATMGRINFFISILLFNTVNIYILL